MDSVGFFRWSGSSSSSRLFSSGPGTRSLCPLRSLCPPRSPGHHRLAGHPPTRPAWEIRAMPTRPRRGILPPTAYSRRLSPRSGTPPPPFPLPGRILRCAESGPRDRDRDRGAWPHAHAGIPPFSPESFSSVEKAIHGPFPKALRASALLKDVRLTSAFFFFLNVRTVVSLMFTRIFGD